MITTTVCRAPHTHTKRNKNATKIMVNYKWFYYRFRTTTVVDDNDNNAIKDANRRWWYSALCLCVCTHSDPISALNSCVWWLDKRSDDGGGGGMTHEWLEGKGENGDCVYRDWRRTHIYTRSRNVWIGHGRVVHVLLLHIGDVCDCSPTNGIYLYRCIYRLPHITEQAT